MPVAQKDVRASRQDLAVGVNPDVDARVGLTDGVRLVPVRSIARNDRRRFGGSVPLQHRYAHQLPAVRERGIEVGAAANHELQGSAQPGVDGSEQDAPQRHGQVLGDSEQSGQRRFFARASGFALDRIEKQIERLGDEADHRNAVLRQRAENRAGLAADRVDDARSTRQGRQHADRLLEHVAQRKQ